MRHPEVLLIPILLLGDYFLTLAGARLAEVKYRQHFRAEHYELNPLWQKSVAKRKWFNPLHLVLVALISAWFFSLASSSWMEDGLVVFLIGVYFGTHGAVVGRHLSNIQMFRRLKNNPDEIRGEVYMTHPLVLAMAQSNYLGTLFPLGLLAIFTRHSMVIGAACGVGLIYAVHGLWRARARRAAAQRARAPVAQSPSAQ